MFKVGKLQLMTGVDIFVPQFRVKIHQPSIREIAILDEGRFFKSLNTILMIDKETVLNSITDEKKKNSLKDISNIEVFRWTLSQNKEMRLDCEDLFSLILQDYRLEIIPQKITLKSYNDKKYPDMELTEDFLRTIKEILQQIFKTKDTIDKNKLAPEGDFAKEIARKIEKSRAVRSKANEKEEDDSILSFYLSILGVGSNSLNLKDLSDLTVYQLYDQLERFNLYEQHKQEFQIALTGTKIDITDWLEV